MSRTTVLSPEKARMKALLSRPNPGHVWAFCWCGHTAVELATSRIGVDTDSCGRPECTPPAGSAP